MLPTSRYDARSARAAGHVRWPATIAALVALPLAVLATAPALGQIVLQDVYTGGGGRSTGADHVITGSVGQSSAVGPGSANGIAHSGGFWHPFPEGKLVLPEALDLGRVPVDGGSNSRVVTLANTGDAGIVVDSFTIGGAGAATYTVVPGGPAPCPPPPFTLAPGASCTIVVRFDPTAPGQANGTLTLLSGQSAEPLVITLVGAGAAGAPVPGLSHAALLLLALMLAAERTWAAGRARKPGRDKKPLA